ncbi:MAG: AmmeMemoRadiSam system protein A [Tepidanaerobacteraceae bacterium]|jgi:AmmeMemoRadiSam system protein A|nr:AmmeMemoRadiSam system protein A [Tepidanaerobacteraceae bacterium]
MAVVAGFHMPHPPIMVREVGGVETQKVKSTIDAAEEVGRQIRELAADTVVIVSPHGPVFRDAVCIYDFPLKGSLASFGAAGVKMEFESDEELKKEILQMAGQKRLTVVRSRDVFLSRYGIKEELDHGVVVPMHFVSKFASGFRLLPIAYGILPYEDLYAFGATISDAAEALGKRVVVVASSDLSHRLIPGAPAGYSPRGAEFDHKLVSLLENFDVEKIAELESGLIEEAGECGLRSIWVMLGALDGCKVKARVLSYEGPFGVGYCVASFYPEANRESLLKKLYEKRRQKIENRRKNEDPYVRLARQTLETYVKEGRIPEIPADLPEDMLAGRAGVFVSIKKHGELRGCIGTYLPTRKNIAEEIQHNAISAGCEDPRFDPVKPEELPELVYSVDVLTKPEPVDSPDKLDPKRYGVIVKKGYRSGLLLPDLEGVDTVEEQISIALRKAGISPDEDYKLERFEVVRHY